MVIMSMCVIVGAFCKLALDDAIESRKDVWRKSGDAFHGVMDTETMLSHLGGLNG